MIVDVILLGDRRKTIAIHISLHLLRYTTIASDSVESTPWQLDNLVTIVNVSSRASGAEQTLPRRLHRYEYSISHVHTVQM